MELCRVSSATLSTSKLPPVNSMDDLQEDDDEETELPLFQTSDIDDFDDISNDEMVDVVEPLLNDLSLSSSATDDPPDESVYEDNERLHGYTSTTTVTFCHSFLSLLRQTNVSKVKAKAYLDLIRSSLPHPNNLPASIDEVFAVLDIKKSLFHKRIVCLLCQNEVSSNANTCRSCLASDETSLAFVYDADLLYMVNVLLKRMHRPIADYSKAIKLGLESSARGDIPFGSLYQKLVHRYPNSNLISALLHLDGISLAKSSKLRLWLFSFAVVELPPKLRFARHNMPVISIWVGYREPIPQLWLRNALSSLDALKSNGIE